jgi:hypothetical protein
VFVHDILKMPDTKATEIEAAIAWTARLFLDNPDWLIWPLSLYAGRFRGIS